MAAFGPFGKKPQTGSVNKEGPPLGGPDVAGPVSTLSSLKAILTEAEVPEITKLQNEVDTAFSPFMDDLVFQQKLNPTEPFLVIFGMRKGEKPPTPTPSLDTGALADTRTLLLITPNAEGSFTAITRRGPRELKPNTPDEEKKIQDIIDHCLENKKGDFQGGFFPLAGSTDGQIVVGYSRSDGKGIMNFNVNLLPTPSTEAVKASIQASRESAHTRKLEKEKPLKEAREQANASKAMADELSAYVKKPFQPSPDQGTAAPPQDPSAPTI